MNREASSLPQDVGQVFAGNIFQSHPTTREAGKCSLLQKGHRIGKELLRHVWLFATPQTNPTQPSRLLNPWNSPGKNTGVGSHFFSRGSSQPQGWNPGLLNCMYSLFSEPPGKPKQTGKPLAVFLSEGKDEDSGAQTLQRFSVEGATSKRPAVPKIKG